VDFLTVPPISVSAVRWSSVNLNTSAINQNPFSVHKTHKRTQKIIFLALSQQLRKGNPFYHEGVEGSEDSKDNT